MIGITDPQVTVMLRVLAEIQYTPGIGGYCKILPRAGAGITLAQFQELAVLAGSQVNLQSPSCLPESSWITTTVESPFSSAQSKFWPLVIGAMIWRLGIFATLIALLPRNSAAHSSPCRLK